MNLENLFDTMKEFFGRLRKKKSTVAEVPNYEHDLSFDIGLYHGKRKLDVLDSKKNYTEAISAYEQYMGGFSEDNRPKDVHLYRVVRNKKDEIIKISRLR